MTVTFYMTDGSSHAFTCPLTGFVTLDTEQIFTAKKIFSVSPEVPDVPANEHSAINQDWAENAAYADDTVNNLIHKEGNERITGTKTVYAAGFPSIRFSSARTTGSGGGVLFYMVDATDPDNPVDVLVGGATSNIQGSLKGTLLLAYGPGETAKSFISASYDSVNDIGFGRATSRNSGDINDYDNNEIITKADLVALKAGGYFS